jgi:hypothetical protein
MSYPPILRARREILADVSLYLEEVRDEVVLDMDGKRDTLALAGTCYGAAVRECLPIGTHTYLLKVRPDMRRLLLLQLRGIYGAYPVCHFPEDPGKRWILTGEAYLRFAPEATTEQRRSSLEAVFGEFPEGTPLPNGTYDLPGGCAGSPQDTCARLRKQPFVLQASPVGVSVPAPRRDLLWAESAWTGEQGT